MEEEKKLPPVGTVVGSCTECNARLVITAYLETDGLRIPIMEAECAHMKIPDEVVERFKQ